MADLPFLDTNVPVYAYSDDPRSAVAQQLMTAPYVTGVQVLNEFANVSRRKLGLSWPIIETRLAAFCRLAEAIVPLSFELHRLGCALAERHQLSVYDALIVAAALEAECELLYSEDMHHGFVIEGRLTILNPFR